MARATQNPWKILPTRFGTPSNSTEARRKECENILLKNAIPLELPVAWLRGAHLPHASGDPGEDTELPTERQQRARRRG